MNDAPPAYSQTVTTTQGHTLAITLTGCDTEGDALTYRIVIGPTHGTLGGTAPPLTYTPVPGYAGPDSFTFVVNDGELDSAPATIRIDIRALIYLPVVVTW
ncbi:MAG: Ig-like domain-containing protein [Chloroflexia bacterium]